MASALAKHFAEHGCEKMIYDSRMGPLALDNGDRITIVYHANPRGRIALPHLIEFDSVGQRPPPNEYPFDSCR